MSGIHATGLAEISHDPSVLDDGNFWAVVQTFEGEQTFARFDEVRSSIFPKLTWQPLDSQWSSSKVREQYIDYVTTIQGAISEGTVYQVNACRVLSTPYSRPWGEMANLFSKLLDSNPAPFSSYLHLPSIEIASASPERFISREGREVLTSPMKGTLPEGRSNFGEKDKSENLMIVDLMRNDLGRVCDVGSVDVSEIFRVEQHPGVAQLVSDVRGKVNDGLLWGDFLAAITPPGSVSGAPKSSALRLISEHEDARGPYCGALGWIHGDRCELAVGIRTFWRDESNLYFGTGAGITWSSRAEQEWNETELKASRLISIAGGSR